MANKSSHIVKNDHFYYYMYFSKWFNKIINIKEPLKEKKLKMK